MKKRNVTLWMFALLIAGSSATVVAQETPCHERILVPVRANQVPGAHGSLWQTFLTITNHSDSPVHVSGIGDCTLPPCTAAVVPPNATVMPRIYGPYIGTSCEELAKLAMSLRVRDLSRALDTWGTSIPLVHERDVHYGGLISITDIPNTAEFRSMLRIYGMERGTNNQVRLAFFAVTPNQEHDKRGITADEPLVELHVLLSHDNPGTVEIPLQMVTELQNEDVVRVEITGSEGVGLWAMVSATNNDTQHVTMLWPRGPQLDN